MAVIYSLPGWRLRFYYRLHLIHHTDAEALFNIPEWQWPIDCPAARCNVRQTSQEENIYFREEAEECKRVIKAGELTLDFTLISEFFSLGLIL